MKKINKIWFADERIYMQTDNKEVYSRPLEAFPILKEASIEQRLNFSIGKFADDIRWEEIDEDIHISSFFDTTEPDMNNELARIFNACPELNVSEIARSIQINKSLLFKYIYGIKKPSDKRINEIKDALKRVSAKILEVV